MDLGQKIAAAADLDGSLQAIVEHFAADSGTIHFLDDENLLRLKAASRGIPPQVVAVIQTIPVGKGMAGLAVERRRPVDACNLQTDTSGDVRPGAKATGMEGTIVVPIFRDDAVIGALGIASRAERTFSTGEIDALIAAGRALAAR